MGEASKAPRDANAVGPDFDVAKLEMADHVARQIVDEVGASLQAGMSQHAIVQRVRDTAHRYGVSRHWHRPVVRVGEQTLLPFRSDVDPMRRVEAGDVVSIDIGVVVEGHEGDRGDTWVVGRNEALERLRDDAHAVWSEAAALAGPGADGRRIYEHARAEARRRGRRLMPGVRGHRVGDWPHGRYVRGPLDSPHVIPANGLWILEIHLLSDALGRGVFVEGPLGASIAPRAVPQITPD